MERLERIRHFLNREMNRGQMSAKLKVLLGDDAIYIQGGVMTEMQRVQEICRILARSRL